MLHARVHDHILGAGGFKEVHELLPPLVVLLIQVVRALFAIADVQERLHREKLQALYNLSLLRSEFKGISQLAVFQMSQKRL